MELFLWITIGLLLVTGLAYVVNELPMEMPQDDEDDIDWGKL